MESMGKTASPYLSVLEIQTAQIGQVGLSCLLQLPGKSLGLTSTRTENSLSPGHSSMVGGVRDYCRVRAPATVSGRPSRLDRGSAGSNVPLLGRGSTGHSILQERVLRDADAVAYGARRQALWAWHRTPQDEGPSVGAGCVLAPLPASSSFL